MKVRTKLLVACLTVIMLVGLSPLTASADSESDLTTGSSALVTQNDGVVPKDVAEAHDLIEIELSPESSTFTVGLDVTYGQTEARSMLDMVNEFRKSDQAWAWNSSDTEKVQYTG